MSEEYIVIPGTNIRIYDGSVVILNRLPELKWVVHYGYYSYGGRSRKGWYLSAIPSGSTMPVYNEDLAGMRVIAGPGPVTPCPPYPPVPPCPPYPPVPVPTIYTPEDKLMVARSMITVDTIEARDLLGSDSLIDGKICRVNNIDGEGNPDFYVWNATKYEWEEATLGYRYLTRSEIEEEISTGVVSIIYSDVNGALVVANNAGLTSEVPLIGLAHSPVYLPEELTLRIPVFGSEDVIVTLPKDKSLIAVRYEDYYLRPDGSRGPSLVFVVSDGTTSTEIVTDASALRNVYVGGTSNTATIIIEQGTNQLTCDVKISSFVNNALKVDNTGLYVDISSKVDKQSMQQGYILISDGLGGFTQAAGGIRLASTGTISDLIDPSKYVVTANLITQAIDAAISEAGGTIAEFARRLDAMDIRMDDFDERLAHVEIEHGTAITTSTGQPIDTIVLGGGTIDPDTASEGVLATEAGVVNYFSFSGF